MENKPVGTGAGDLIVYYCGVNGGDPRLSWGPGIRDHYIIHLVLDGKGKVIVDGKTFYVKQGEGFLLKPEEVAFYRSDDKTPWTYTWAGFHGDRAYSLLQNAGLANGVTVFSFTSQNRPEKYFLEMNEEIAGSQSRDARLTGLLYLFFSSMIDMYQRENGPSRTENTTAVYTERAVEYIRKNYSRKISVAEIAGFLGVDRRYFHRFFKSQVNKSPQEYIISYRMEKACELMNKDNLTIADISRSVGYDDQFLFSRIFHKYKGIPPVNYRKGMEDGKILFCAEGKEMLGR